MNINNTNHHYGRFGNQFLVSMALNYLAKKNDLLVNYKEYENFKILGIKLYIDGKNTYNETIKLNDDIFFKLIISENPQYKNFSIDNDFWCQTKEFVIYLKKNFYNEHKDNIIENNIFKERYKNNNDLFIHVRLGDIIEMKNNEPYEYYEKAIDNLNNNYDIGYISSDSIDNDICLKLINKYNLKIINYNIVKTIMFATTTKNIILSSGTFSWLIGFLSFYSKILYPKFKNRWFGDIFVFEDWFEIDF